MSQYTGQDELSGLFKEVYGDDIVNLIPDTAMLTKMVKFDQKDKEGNKYHQPVIVAYSHGFTYNTSSHTAYALNNHIAMTTQDAQIEGSEIVLRDALGYRAAAKAMGGNKKAFKEATELVVENMVDSMTKRLEISMLYGNSGLGQVQTLSNTNSTTEVCTFVTGTFAVGIWSGSVNAVVNFYNGASLVSSAADADFVISAVDPVLKKITVTGTTTGITALNALNGTALDVYFKGSKGEEMNGLNAILINSGTLFNISAASYDLWAGNTYSAGSAQLTMNKVLQGLAGAVGRGLNEKITLLCNPLTWQNLSNDLAALRKFDGSYKRGKAENGFEAVSYYGPMGEVEVVGWNIVKEGEAFAIPMGQLKRLGATDITFQTPGRKDEIFLQLPSNAGFELRCYADQAIFLQTPARAVKFTSIVNA